MTVRALNIYDRIRDDNRVFWHMVDPGDETMVNASSAEVYITSANAISEEGYIINIDGRGNRVAAINAHFSARANGYGMRPGGKSQVCDDHTTCATTATAMKRTRRITRPATAAAADQQHLHLARARHRERTIGCECMDVVTRNMRFCATRRILELVHIYPLAVANSHKTAAAGLVSATATA